MIIFAAVKAVLFASNRQSPAGLLCAVVFVSLKKKRFAGQCPDAEPGEREDRVSFLPCCSYGERERPQLNRTSHCAHVI
jgi:hypothetical protein